MAERRMFSKSITNSARFLRMPATSRLLYYDLGMAADDDGVVEAFTVMRTTGATEDDLAVLTTKGFVHVLNEDLVTVILDWRQNNQIRSDRYKKSVYAHLLEGLTNGLPDGNQMTTERDTNGKPRSGEGSIGDIVADKPPKKSRFTPPSLEDVQTYCQERGNSVDPQRFLDHYTASGWMRGKTSIKDWKACVRTWERQTAGESPAEEPRRVTGYQVDGEGRVVFT